MKPRVKGKPKPPESGALSSRLREVVRARGLTAYAIARDSGVDVRAIQRFLDGEKDLRLESADRIAAALGLSLVEVRVKRGRPARYPTGDES